MGTPTFHWNAARQTFSAGDFIKANDNLEEVLRTDNEYTARALPWRLVLLSGMAKGYGELADTWEYGARANRANPTPFRTLVTEYRKLAGQLAIQFAETLQKLQAGGEKDKVIIDFPYPTGSAAEIAALKRISSGILIPEAEIETVRKRVLERAVLLAACRAVGAPDDAARAQQIFKSDTVQVEWPVFALALAHGLYDLSQLFTFDKLDRSDRLQLFLDQATKMLQAVAEDKEVKALKAKIEKSLKKKR